MTRPKTLGLSLIATLGLAGVCASSAAASAGSCPGPQCGAAKPQATQVLELFVPSPDNSTATPEGALEPGQEIEAIFDATPEACPVVMHMELLNNKGSDDRLKIKPHPAWSICQKAYPDGETWRQQWTGEYVIALHADGEASLSNPAEWSTPYPTPTFFEEMFWTTTPALVHCRYSLPETLSGSLEGGTAQLAGAASAMLLGSDSTGYCPSNQSFTFTDSLITTIHTSSGTSHLQRVLDRVVSL